MTIQSDSRLNLFPVLNTLQKIAIYELKDWVYVVGSNNSLNLFRLLKIDRKEPKDLVVIDDGEEYTQSDIQNFIATRARGVTAKSAFGIVGFVRFLEGYYLLLITKRRRVAALGLHYIYKIEDTTMIYIPNESSRTSHPDEARYVKMFQSIDLSSNFYFSYSYDITHTLQVNMAVPKKLQNWGNNDNNTRNLKKERRQNQTDYELYSSPNLKFVWNLYLLSKIKDVIHRDWIIYIIHGFISQSNLNIFGRSVYVTLIARRSNKYAGTRFLKRGANTNGDVANEVETEQVIEDMGVSSWHVCPRISSFVQMRGSIPGHWSQDIAKIVPKPTIAYDLSDPFVITPGRHFKQLFDRYGSPIIALNLVKQKEKKKHESTLSIQYSSDIKYLNQFLSPEHHIQYVTFDMARKNKGKVANVMGRLARIGENALAKVGVFCTFTKKLQTGVIRVNCVDCLDRTNTAQFALGKCALAKQLETLGLLETLELKYDTDCIRLLEVLYEDHGDTLALQYGGSQLVHRIKTYRKTAPWTSQGNDIMQTLSRYYSNTFSDFEKQHAMNLFLGLFIPYDSPSPIWEQITDYYLHHPETITLFPLEESRLPLTQWWGEKEVTSLSREYLEREADVKPLLNPTTVDVYSDFHRIHEFTALMEIFPATISHSVRDFMPNCVTDYSPFTVRVGPGRRREENSKGFKNPSVSGQSSTSSATSSDECSQESEEEDVKTESRQSSSPAKGSTESARSSQGNIFALKPISSQDMQIYKRYVVIGRQSIRTKEGTNKPLAHSLKPMTEFTDSTEQTKAPVVTKKSLDFYANYVKKMYSIDECITPQQAERYARYCNNQLYIYKGVGWD
ncbi:polyphosphoinositide phosphatase [Halyomorpha halys]|uniref:polyphosphoinositide phosphatase n=1 Tax=Halyomorpha halys TaxID=286706 RepID=UPI0006D4EE78|nr:polyphosphoinositide phosphatase [Halyomorpha halys]